MMIFTECPRLTRQLPLGVNTDALHQLDAATRQAEADLKAMVKQLDANAKAHCSFMAELGKLRAAAAK